MLRSISGPRSNDEQPPDSTGRLPEVLITAGIHCDINERRRTHPFYSQLCFAEKTNPKLPETLVFLHLSYALFEAGLKPTNEEYCTCF